jgi:hypothetical protein
MSEESKAVAAEGSTSTSSSDETMRKRGRVASEANEEVEVVQEDSDQLKLQRVDSDQTNDISETKDSDNNIDQHTATSATADSIADSDSDGGTSNDASDIPMTRTATASGGFLESSSSAGRSEDSQKWLKAPAANRHTRIGSEFQASIPE